jgi:hypothetical protein
MRIGKHARRSIESLLVLGIGVALVVMAVADGADGATACKDEPPTYCKLSQVHSQDTAFLNYDFTEQNHSRHKVDWPVDLVFWNLSSRRRIARILRFEFRYRGSEMNGYVNNGHGWRWSTDDGPKTAFWRLGDAYHFRIYAPPRFGPHGERLEARERMFNLRWGFYDIATAHIDHDEGFGWSGNSEKAEKMISRIWFNHNGEGSVFYSQVPMLNFEEAYWEGTHYWRNDGNATKLRVPSLAEMTYGTS